MRHKPLHQLDGLKARKDGNSHVRKSPLSKTDENCFYLIWQISRVIEKEEKERRSRCRNPAA
jgi:hypothetical protein